MVTSSYGCVFSNAWRYYNMDALAPGRGLRYNERHKKRSDRFVDRRPMWAIADEPTYG
jgi:hypothetical protein